MIGIMKVKELKAKIAPMDDETDVAIESSHERMHVKFAKRVNNNKRNSEFTPRIFILVSETRR